MSVEDQGPSRMRLTVAMLLLALISVATEAAAARAYPVVPVLSGLAGSPGRMLVPGSNTTKPKLSSHIFILADGMWTPLVAPAPNLGKVTPQGRLDAMCVCSWPAPLVVYRSFWPFDEYGGLPWSTDRFSYSPQPTFRPETVAVTGFPSQAYHQRPVTPR